MKKKKIRKSKFDKNLNFIIKKKNKKINFCLNFLKK